MSNSSIANFFRNRFVQAILSSAFLLQIGIWIRNFAVLLYVMEHTNGDPFAVSMISLAEYAPIFIFSFIGGAFADRWRPKRTMIWCEVLSAGSVFAVLLTLVFGSWKAVFFATLFSAILSQFSQPSGMKLFKMHVPEEQIQMGMSIYQTIGAVFMILGPVLGTFVFQHFGIQASLIMTGIAFLLSAVALTFLPADRMDKVNDETQAARSSVWKELKEGFRFVLGSKILTTLGGCFVAAGLALGLISAMGIFLVTEQLGLPKEDISWFVMTNGVAMIIGGGLAMVYAKKLTPQWLVVIGLSVNSIGLLVCGLSYSVWLTLIAQFICGFVLPCIQIGINTMMLQNTEESFVGRVNGILNPLFMGSMVVTMAMSGWLKSATSLTAMYGSAAVLFIAGVLIMMPLLRLPRVQTKTEEVPIQAVE